MPRRPRAATGGIVYHALNRAVGRMTLFEKEADYAAFERVLDDVYRRLPMRLLAYCLMPNHWHLVPWPRRDGELSEFLRLVTVTHTQRWHAAHRTAGTGPLYQGRFKSFPVECGDHLLMLGRYVEANAMRVKLVRGSARRWQWCSAAARHRTEPPAWLLPLERWPIDVPRGWDNRVDRSLPEAAVEQIQVSMRRGRPLGEPRWVTQTAARLGMQSTLRPRGRPRLDRPDHAKGK